LAIEAAPAGLQTEAAKGTESPSKIADPSASFLSKSVEANFESIDTLAQSLGEPATEFVSPPALTKVDRVGDVVILTRRLRRWRSITAAVGAIAALLAVFAVVTLWDPGLMTQGRLPHSKDIAGSQAPALGGRLVAVLQQEPTAPAFLLTVDPQTRTLIVRRVSATPEPGRSYELWLTSSRSAKPRSLGIVGDDEFTRRAIPANFDADTMRGASLAISLEPSGGSQSGEPTGPILFTGKMVEAVPASTSPAPRT
jgi:anti-sigma-K factor RskA